MNIYWAVTMMIDVILAIELRAFPYIFSITASGGGCFSLHYAVWSEQVSRLVYRGQEWISRGCREWSLRSKHWWLRFMRKSTPCFQDGTLMPHHLASRNTVSSQAEKERGTTIIDSNTALIHLVGEESLKLTQFSETACWYHHMNFGGTTTFRS